VLACAWECVGLLLDYAAFRLCLIDWGRLCPRRAGRSVATWLVCALDGCCVSPSMAVAAAHTSKARATRVLGCRPSKRCGLIARPAPHSEPGRVGPDTTKSCRSGCLLRRKQLNPTASRPSARVDFDINPARRFGRAAATDRADTARLAAVCY